ncbi:MAG: helix-turn-helix domain-containing protein [Calditrichaeota bacterium]|nr:helix-turn-helix domain-containing protein [Calditrichota bacterium]
MDNSFDSIKQGLEEAIQFAEGKDVGAKVFKPTEIDVKALRKKIKMTQVEFAAAFGISIGTLRHWERRDRTPRGPALVLLNLVNKDPETILSVLHNK